MIELNELLVLNNIIYKIHTETDFDSMREFILEPVQTLLKSDMSSFLIVDGLNNKKLGRPVGINCSKKKVQDYINFYQALDYAVPLLHTGRSIVYRESDIIAEDKRVKTDFYNMFYRADNFHHSVHLILAYQGIFLGTISFFRQRGKENFEKQDMLYLELIQEHLNHRVYTELHMERTGKYTMDEIVKAFGLTSKESLVLECLLDGKDNYETAVYIGVAQNTVKKHLVNIYRKTQCSSKIVLLQKIRK